MMDRKRKIMSKLPKKWEVKGWQESLQASVTAGIDYHNDTTGEFDVNKTGGSGLATSWAFMWARPRSG